MPLPAGHTFRVDRSTAMDVRGRRPRWLFITLALVLLARATMPVGFMPDRATAGEQGLSIVVCTGHGVTTVNVGGTSSDGVPGSRSGAAPPTDPCPFALALVGAVMAPDAAIPWQSHAGEQLRPSSCPQSPLLASIFGPLGPRAPPAG